VATITSSLLLLYPRAWRQRYGAEMEEMLTAERLTVRTVVDLVAGAIDARLNPQWLPAVGSRRVDGGANMTTLSRCGIEGVTVRDQWRSAGWMIGGSAGLTLLAVGLIAVIGRNSLSDGLLYSAFPASLMLSSECTYFKRYSRPARAVMSLGGAIFIVLITWAAVAIGELL
jgi:hypothetical protein